MHRNKAKLIYALQKFYILQQKKGVKVKMIYRQIISLYPMSMITFYNYMATPIADKIKDINKEELKKFTKNVIKSLQRIADEA